MRNVAVALGFVALLALAPTVSACGGLLTPGDELISGGERCTLAFLLADPSGLYFATAGHCIKENASAENPVVGKFGVGAFRHLVPDTGDQTAGAPGDDFALIRIDPDAYSKVGPTVCGWGGPKGIYDATPGSGGVKHYGWGVGFGELGMLYEDAHKREGLNLENDNKAFYWTGAGVPGDSGSAVLSEDGRALGVLTHLTFGGTGTNGGTHIYRGFKLAAERGFDLRLVLDGEDPLRVLADVRANASMQPGDTGPTPTSPAAPTAKPSPAPGTQPTNATKPTSATRPASTTPTGDDLASAADSGPRDAPAPALAFVLAAIGVAFLTRKRR